MSSNSGTNLHPDGGDGGGAAVAPPPGYALSGKIMLIVIVVLFTTVLLILFIHLYLRWRLFRRRTSFRRRHLVFAGEGSAPPAASRGLEPKVIRSLPVLIISDSSAAVEGAAGAECAVCLSEFEAGEKARELPRCGHRFHIDCIDMWFHSHDTCPLCRATVEAPPAPAPAPVMNPATESSIAAGTEERIESSSASDRDGGELRIEVPMRRGMGEEELGLGLRLGLGLGSPAVKSPGSRFLLLRRLVSCRDLLVDRGSELDLERGEGAAPVIVPVVAM